MTLFLSPDVRYDVRMPAMVPRDLAAIWKEAAEEATRTPGDIWRALFNLPLTANAREIFARARKENGWSFVLPPHVLFHPERLPIECTFFKQAERFTFDLETPEQVRNLQTVLSGEWQTLDDDGDVRVLAEDFVDAHLLTEEEESPQRFTEPGIYRLPNSSVLFRSGEASVLLDPAFFEGRWLSGSEMAAIDAIVISHSHMDHFSYLSLLQLPRTVTIVVPAVEKQSILSDDMAGMLDDAGFTNVIVAPWYTSHTVKDITIHALPFYGEQPWLSFASPDFALRNCGNTYVVETPTERTWLLVDSGFEHGHTILDVAGDAVKFGAIDIVMSGVHEVRWHPGQIDGMGGQWWCFPADKLSAPETWPVDQLMKLDSTALNRLLTRVEARHFFPYTTPPYLAGHPSEVRQTAQIEAVGPLTTELHTWSIGDRIEMKRGRTTLHAAERGVS